MQSTRAIAAFIDDLALPSSQVQLLTSTLESNLDLSTFLGGTEHSQSGLVSLACFVAQEVLGAESVNTAPVDQTEIDANW